MNEIKIYTWPDCPNCSRLKNWLEEKEYEFVSETLTSTVQAELIMENVFGSPPIIKTEKGVLVGEELFVDHEINLDKLRELL